MFTHRHMTRALAAVTAVGALAIPAGAQAHARASGPTIIRLTAKRESSRATPRAVSGDRFTYSDQLRRGSTLMGRDTAVCNYSDPIYFTCELTITLRDGTIKVSIPSHDPAEVLSAEIYGGTGRYAGATGSLTISDAMRKTSQYRLSITA